MRLEIGDTVEADKLFDDAELQVFIDRRSEDVLLAAADACEQLSRRFGRAYDFETDGQSFKRSQMSKQYAQLARTLRERATGVSSKPTTRVDGYSDDVAYDDTDATSTHRGRVAIGWDDPDLPF